MADHQMGSRLPPRRICATVAVAITLSSGCGGGNADPHREIADGVSSFSHAAFAPTEIRGRVLSTDSILSLPYDVVVYSDSEVVVVDANPPFLHVMNRRTGAVRLSRGRRGQGPGEFLSVAGAVRLDSTRIWAYEVERNIAVLVELEERTSKSDSSLRLVARGASNFPLHATDTSLIVMSRSDSSTVVRYDLRSGRYAMVGHPGPLPTLNGDTLGAKGRRQLHSNARMCYEPTLDKFVAVHRLSGRIDYLNGSGDIEADASVPYRFPPVLELAGEGDIRVLLQAPGQRFAYVDCALTQPVVLALFSGRRFGAFPNAEVQNASFVHVFDWSGKLLRVLHLDVPIYAMTFDDRTGEIIGVQFRPEPAVVVFPLRDAVPELGMVNRDR